MSTSARSARTTSRSTTTVRPPRSASRTPPSANRPLDPDRSYAVSKERGLLDRLGDLFSDNPNSEQAVQQLAVRHIGDAAEQSGLTARAESNTTDMLEGLLHSLGFKEVKVTYGS